MTRAVCLRSEAKMTSGWCSRLLVLVGAACDAAKGEPPSLEGNKVHKSLVHTGCQHSLESDDDKRLVPTGCRHSFWSQDDKRLVPSAVGTRSCTPLPLPLGEQGSQVATAHRLSAFVCERG